MNLRIKVLTATTSIIILLLTGCIDYSSTVIVNPDGSGTIEETILLDESITQILASFMQDFGDSAKNESDFDLFTEEEIVDNAAQMGEGVKYISSKKIENGGKEGYTAVYQFDDITKLKLTDDPSEKIPSGELMIPETGEDNDNITFTFKKGNVSILNVLLPESEYDSLDFAMNPTGDDSTAEESSSIDEETRMILKGLKISMKFEIIGNIIETNAAYLENNTISLFEIDFEKLLENPDKLKEFQKIQAGSIQQAKEILKNIPGLKLEPEEKVTIKFN